MLPKFSNKSSNKDMLFVELLIVWLVEMLIVLFAVLLIELFVFDW